MTFNVATTPQKPKIFCHIYCPGDLSWLVVNLSILGFVTSAKASIQLLVRHQTPNVMQSDTNQ